MATHVVGKYADWRRGHESERHCDRIRLIVSLLLDVARTQFLVKRFLWIVHRRLAHIEVKFFDSKFSLLS